MMDGRLYNYHIWKHYSISKVDISLRAMWKWFYAAFDTNVFSLTDKIHLFKFYRIAILFVYYSQQLLLKINSAEYSSI